LFDFQQLSPMNILALDYYAESLGVWCYTKLLQKPLRVQLNKLGEIHVPNLESQLQNLSPR